MQEQHITLPAFYIRQIAEQMRTRGVDVAAWLERSGLKEEQLRDDCPQIAMRVFRHLLEDGLALTEPSMGLLVGERLLVNSHGMLGYAAMNAGTVRQAMELVEAYLSVRISLVSVQHDIRGDQVRFLFRETEPLGSIQQPVLEAVMLAIKNVFDYITNGSCPVRCASFPFPEPAHSALARDLFKTPLLYEQDWTGFSFDTAQIDMPLAMADPATFQTALAICQRELDKLNAQQTLGAKVRRLMLEKQSGFPSLNVLAHLLHLTPRTLHRRLKEEGTSYKDILEDVRHMLALELLKAGHLSIQEIGYKLGYTDTANFRRAFKRWEGQPPSSHHASSRV